MGCSRVSDITASDISRFHGSLVRSIQRKVLAMVRKYSIRSMPAQANIRDASHPGPISRGRVHPPAKRWRASGFGMTSSSGGGVASGSPLGQGDRRHVSQGPNDRGGEVTAYQGV